MTLFSFLFSMACTSSGSVVLGDGTGDDTGEIDDTGEVEPEPHMAAGEYEGELTWSVPDADWTICEMDLSVEVDDEGAFEVEEICIYVGRDGTEYDLEVNLEGEFDDEGEVSGEIRFQSWAIEGWNDYYIEDYSSDLNGGLDGDDLELEFFDLAQFGYNGELDMPGFIALER